MSMLQLAAAPVLGLPTNLSRSAYETKTTAPINRLFFTNKCDHPVKVWGFMPAKGADDPAASELKYEQYSKHLKRPSSTTYFYLKPNSGPVEMVEDAAVRRQNVQRLEWRHGDPNSPDYDCNNWDFIEFNANFALDEPITGHPSYSTYEGWTKASRYYVTESRSEKPCGNEPGAAFLPPPGGPSDFHCKPTHDETPRLEACYNSWVSAAFNCAAPSDEPSGQTYSPLELDDGGDCSYPTYCWAKDESRGKYRTRCETSGWTLDEYAAHSAIVCPVDPANRAFCKTIYESSWPLNPEDVSGALQGGNSKGKEHCFKEFIDGKFPACGVPHAKDSNCKANFVNYWRHSGVPADKCVNPDGTSCGMDRRQTSPGDLPNVGTLLYHCDLASGVDLHVEACPLESP